MVIFSAMLGSRHSWQCFCTHFALVQHTPSPAVLPCKRAAQCRHHSGAPLGTCTSSGGPLPQQRMPQQPTLETQLSRDCMVRLSNCSPLCAIFYMPFFQEKAKGHSKEDTHGRRPMMGDCKGGEATWCCAELEDTQLVLQQPGKQRGS